MQPFADQVDVSIDHILADEALRHHLFPVTQKRIFMAHAGVAPLPGPAVAALKYEAERASHGQEGPEIFAEVEAIPARGRAPHQRQQRRGRAARAHLPRPEPGCARPRLEGGDEVVFYPDDYPANVYPWTALAARGVKAVPLQPERTGEITPELVFAALTPRTRLVALASCHYLSGFRLDYETIGEELHHRGVLFCLDAIQSLGATTIDVRRVDFLAADSHKWMLGPLGAGIFYVKRRHFEALRPALLGAWNVRSPDFIAQPDIVYENSARRYEPGALNLIALHGMKASIELILGLGVKQIEARLLDLRTFAEDQFLARGFKVIGFANRRSQKSGITTLAIDSEGKAAAWAKKLPRQPHRRLSLRHVRSGVACLRLSPHFYNTEAEIEEVLKILLS